VADVHGEWRIRRTARGEVGAGEPRFRRVNGPAIPAAQFVVHV